uniref:hypothetical protein n=1 Tax=Cupriavidus taiwanensis TaxID=164546 RepID=UPI0011C05195|nr:hypothetical protein [Cupriavidus taiwanensis]
MKGEKPWQRAVSESFGESFGESIGESAFTLGSRRLLLINRGAASLGQGDRAYWGAFRRVCQGGLEESFFVSSGSDFQRHMLFSPCCNEVVVLRRITAFINGLSGLPK